jgi:citrate lyase subunit beta/citryl-CoA lyase
MKMNLQTLETLIKQNDIKKALTFIKKSSLKPISTKKRSVLMVSAHQAKHLLKIPALKADVIMLNLEDGVPKEKKEIARIVSGIILSNLKDIDKEIVIRVNPLTEGGIEDIKFLDQFNFNAFRIPKVKSPKEIEIVKKLTNKDIHLSVETKETFFELKDFNVKVSYIGIYDLLNDLNLPHSIISLQNPLIHKILSDFSLNSRYLDIIPIGFVYQQYKDLEGFKKWCLLQKDLGLQGVGCITPAQVEIANLVFSEDKELAKMIVERFEKEGPFTINGLYVDEPIVKNFLISLNLN